MDQIEILRKAITIGENLYSKAFDRCDYDTANFIAKTIDGLENMLAEVVMTEDPFTTDADIRFFEINP